MEPNHSHKRHIVEFTVRPSSPQSSSLSSRPSSSRFRLFALVGTALVVFAVVALTMLGAAGDGGDGNGTNSGYRSAAVDATPELADAFNAVAARSQRDDAVDGADEAAGGNTPKGADEDGSSVGESQGHHDSDDGGSDAKYSDSSGQKQKKSSSASSSSLAADASSSSASDDGGFTLRQINPPVGLDPSSPLVGALRHTHEAELNFTCPPFRYPKGKSADSQTVQEAMYKYARYTRDYCNTSGLLQMQVPLSTYTKILDKIAELVRIKPNDKLFDWGSGCGTMLNYYHLKYNSSGIGIDVTDAAVRHAITHRQPNQLFCLLNGVDLRAFADESFDAVVTWATVYHVRRTMQQCEIVTNMVRMMRPGGRAFIGHLRTDKTQEYWKKKKCRIPGAVISKLRDWKTFRQKGWRRHDFFSLLVYKQFPNETAAATTTVAPAEATLLL